MAVLKQGAPTKTVGDAQIDTLLPITLTASATLAPGTHQKTQADPTLGDVVLTLPDPATNAGVSFFVKRITNSGNIVKLIPAGLDSIDEVTTGFLMSLEQEYVEVYSDGTAIWKRERQRRFAFGALESTSGSFAATTTPAKLTAWNAVRFETPQRIVPSTVDNDIDIVDFNGPIQDGYKVDFVMSFDFTNNQTVTAQIYSNGALQGHPVSVNALGTGKPVTLSINEPLTITSATQVELHISVETNGTINNINGSLVLERIGG